MHPDAGELWARPMQPDPAEETPRSRWHRVALASDVTVETICGRAFLAPMETSAEIPAGEFSCPVCESMGPSTP